MQEKDVNISPKNVEPVQLTPMWSGVVFVITVILIVICFVHLATNITMTIDDDAPTYSASSIGDSPRDDEISDEEVMEIARRFEEQRLRGLDLSDAKGSTDATVLDKLGK